jgi:hypothetical protein
MLRTGFDLQGVFDIHVHSYPSFFPRVGDDLKIVEDCIAAGMSGLALKEHHESTVSRAYLLNKLYPNFRVIGGVTLNYPVGGINPAAVQASFALGGRIVWMPSGHAKYHGELTGKVGSWGVKGMNLYVPEGSEGISVLDENGDLTNDTKEVVKLIKEYDGVLCMAHLSPTEILKLGRYAKREGVKRILVNHVMFMPQCDINYVKTLVEEGLMVEICTVTVDSSSLQSIGYENALSIIEVAGPDRCIISSDGGGTIFPSHSETLRVFANTVINKGVKEEHVYRMMRDNPLKLIEG